MRNQFNVPMSRQWSRRELLGATPVFALPALAGCSDLGLSSAPPVNVAVNNGRSQSVEVNVQVIEGKQTAGEELFSRTFTLSAYDPDAPSADSNADIQDAFNATEARVECRMDDESWSFFFESSCGESDDVDEGLSLDVLGDNARKDGILYRQSRCS